jgi:hypothetical protein
MRKARRLLTITTPEAALFRTLINPRSGNRSLPAPDQLTILEGGPSKRAEAPTSRIKDLELIKDRVGGPGERAGGHDRRARPAGTTGGHELRVGVGGPG